MQDNGIVDMRGGEGCVFLYAVYYSGHMWLTDVLALPRYMYADLSRAGPLLNHYNLRWVRSFYDVFCQYSVNMKTRFVDKTEFKSATAEFFTLMTERILGGIPSLHIKGHIRRCRAIWTVPHLRYTGHTPTEMVETQWAETKKLGGSVKHENHGQRHDDIDWLFMDHNHAKTVALRASYCVMLS